MESEEKTGPAPTSGRKRKKEQEKAQEQEAREHLKEAPKDRHRITIGPTTPSGPDVIVSR